MERNPIPPFLFVVGYDMRVSVPFCSFLCPSLPEILLPLQLHRTQANPDRHSINIYIYIYPKKSPLFFFLSDSDSALPSRGRVCPFFPSAHIHDYGCGRALLERTVSDTSLKTHTFPPFGYLLFYFLLE